MRLQDVFKLAGKFVAGVLGYVFFLYTSIRLVLDELGEILRDAIEYASLGIDALFILLFLLFIYRLSLVSYREKFDPKTARSMALIAVLLIVYGLIVDPPLYYFVLAVFAAVFWILYTMMQFTKAGGIQARFAGSLATVSYVFGVAYCVYGIISYLTVDALPGHAYVFLVINTALIAVKTPRYRGALVGDRSNFLADEKLFRLFVLLSFLAVLVTLRVQPLISSIVGALVNTARLYTSLRSG